MDLTQSIAPKSDQLNAEDLLSGPRTFTIAEVKKGSDEQPVDVHLVEFPGRPFKPSKTVRRLMVAAWGVDSSTYAGQQMTLYRDPAVKFGGMDVGGIRVSHMSGLPKAIRIALTVSRGKRGMYIVEPLPAAAPPITTQQVADLHAGLTKTGRGDREAGLAFCSGVVGREIKATKDLTRDDAALILDRLAADITDAPELALDQEPTA